MDLSQRSDLSELMDDPALPQADYDCCLHDLAAVNRVTLTHRPTLHWLDRATQSLPAGRVVSILDVACGEGDLLRAIYRWAVRRCLAVRLEGIDLNPRSAIAAAARTPPGSGIGWRTGDVFDYSPDPIPDFIVTSQFIADLQRASFAYWGFGLLATVARWHPIVRSDGMISVARSFRRSDWRRLLVEAGVPGEIRWHLAFRWCVGRLK